MNDRPPTLTLVGDPRRSRALPMLAEHEGEEQLVDCLGTLVDRLDPSAPFRVSCVELRARLEQRLAVGRQG